MRFSAATGIAVILAITASSAQAGTNFGGYTCRAPLPCPDESTFPNIEQLSQMATACYTSFTGLSNPEGFFDLDAGLVGNYCLQAKPDALPRMAKVQVAPLCCVIKNPFGSGGCVFHCDTMEVDRGG
jgi:hypothetical protein